MKKALTFRITLCVAIGWMGCGQDHSDKSPLAPMETEDATTGAAAAIAFVDTSLEESIRTALRIPSASLTAEDLLSLTRLEAPGRGISDLRGIGQLGNLQVLDLAGNEIADISPLAALVSLVLLDVAGKWEGNFEIYLATPDARDPYNLTNNPAADFMLSWSPLSVLSYIAEIPEPEPEPGAPSEEPLLFADPNLAATVRDAVGKLPTDTLTSADIIELKFVHAHDKGITDLSGIEAMQWLESSQSAR